MSADDQLFVAGKVLHGPMSVRRRWRQSLAQAGAQRRADGAGGSGDQHAIGFGIDHVAAFPLIREFGHHVRGQQFECFGVVLVGAADEELDARIPVSADQVADLRDGAGDAVELRGNRELAALGGQCGLVPRQRRS